MRQVANIRHQCFVALTRPAMMKGVTLHFLVYAVIVNLGVIFVFSKLGAPWLLYLFPAPMSFVFGRMACHRDPRFFELICGNARFSGFQNKAIWHCVSYEPY